MKIEVVVGNIVKQPDVDAIVNSANANLRLGSGVAGAIHTAAGPKLEEFCKPFAPLELGSALITPGFDLPNPWVIHVRAAHFILNPEPERYMLFSVISMLNTAKENQLKSVAMPAIGTGVFKFPAMLAARITAKALVDFSNNSDAIELVRICVSTEELRQQYQSAVDLFQGGVNRMKRRYQAFALVIASYIPVEVVSRVVTANAYANLYPPDADSISIPIFGAAFNAFAILCVAMLGLAIPIRGWLRYARLIPISLAALWSISPILYWITPNHYWISASYLLPLLLTWHIAYIGARALSQPAPAAQTY